MGRKKLEHKAEKAIWHRLKNETFDKWMNIPKKRRNEVLNKAIAAEINRLEEIDYYNKIGLYNS